MTGRQCSPCSVEHCHGSGIDVTQGHMLRIMHNLLLLGSTLLASTPGCASSRTLLKRAPSGLHVVALLRASNGRVTALPPPRTVGPWPRPVHPAIFNIGAHHVHLL